MPEFLRPIFAFGKLRLSQLTVALTDIKQWVKEAKLAMDSTGVQLNLATGLMDKARAFAVKTDDVTAACKELNAVFSWLQKADAALRGGEWHATVYCT